MIDWVIFIILFISTIVSAVFSAGDAYLIGRWGGGIIYLIFPRARRDALRNINKFTGINQKGMLVSNFKNVMGNVFLDLHILLEKENITIVGKEYLRLNKKGFLFITLHYGLWEIIPFILEHLGVKTVVVFAPSPYRLTEKLIMKIRRRSRAKYIPSSIGVFKLMGHIKAGRAVGIMLDQHRAERRIAIPFLNGRLHIPEAPFFIAEKRKISILPMFSYIKDGKIILRILKPITASSNIASHFKELFQKYIGKNMENFIWTYSGLSQ